MSYIERTLYWFIKERIFGGLKKLKQKEFFPFALLVVFVATLNTILGILHQLNILISLEVLQSMLILQFFISLGLIISGMVIGRIKSLPLYFIGGLLIIGAMVLAYFFFDLKYNLPLIRYSKLTFFIIWVALSCISFFFLMLYFFTSFPKKVMMLGAPKNHIFFEPIIKIVIYISIPIYIYMILQQTIDSYIIGTFGILIALLILLLLKTAPKKVENTPGVINFVSAIGFFYIFLFYHLVVSFSFTSDNLSSFIMDILLLLLITLYIVQNLTRRISDSPERLKSFENPIRFQTRMYITDRLKKAFGEHGVVIMVMGLVLGYHMAYLDSLFVTSLPILSDFFTANLKLSALYHRIYLIFSFIIILGAVLFFYSSKKFQNMMVDKYTAAQVFKYIGSYFKRTDDGVSPFEVGMQELGKKIGDGIKGIGEKWKKSIQEKMAPKPNSEDNSLDP